MGHPMSHSVQSGLNCPPTRLDKLGWFLRASLGAFVSFAMCAVGVGHKPEPVPLVRSPDIGSSQHCPAAVIPDRGQITEDNSKSSSNECWTVFHEDVTGSNFANDPRHVLPHSAALSGDACAPPLRLRCLDRESRQPRRQQFLAKAVRQRFARHPKPGMAGNIHRFVVPQARLARRDPTRRRTRIGVQATVRQGCRHQRLRIDEAHSDSCQTTGRSPCR